MTVPSETAAQQVSIREDAATVLDIQARFIAAAMQLRPAGHARQALAQAVADDFTGHHRTIWEACGRHAQELATTAPDAAPDWAIVSANLMKAGHLDNRHDDGLRKALMDMAQCDANGLIIGQLLDALRQATYEREMTAFRELVAGVPAHPADAALQRIQAGLQRLQQAAARATTPEMKGGVLRAV